MTGDGDLGVVARTDRLLIRPWRIEEAPRLFDILRRIEVVRWLSANNLMTEPEQAVQRIERWTAELAAEPGFGRWAVVERASETPAGTMLLKRLPDGDGEIEIGWYLHPDSWGKGLATEAARALLAYGFAGGLEEIWAVTQLDNNRSAGVCRKVGMRLLGVTNRWYHEPSLMFWVGAREVQEPSVAPDGRAPRSAEA